MKTTSTTTKCHSCTAPVECVQHLRLCDSCLDARLAQLERSAARPLGWTGALRRPTAARADRWSRAVAVGNALRVVV
jgi:hypothetical protein